MTIQCLLNNEIQKIGIAAAVTEVWTALKSLQLLRDDIGRDDWLV
jgi:hypothetical protein